MNLKKTKWIRISVMAAAFLIMAAAYLAGPGKRRQTAFVIDGEEQSLESADPENAEPGNAGPENADPGKLSDGGKDSLRTGDARPDSENGSGRDPAPAGSRSGDGQITASSGKGVPDSGPDSGKLRPDAEKFAVYVCGHVVSPGVVYLPEGSRICDAVTAAGGFAPDAAQDAVNLAMLVSDGLQIRVPGKNEAVSGETGIAGGTHTAAAGQGNGSPQNGGRININTASGEELQQLPGIGKSRAEDIIAYRSKKPFGSIEEIMQVPGIKKGAFGKIKDRIAV
ncbi:helix-hairpin-helix domain-containing protein [[Clostridium] aminophilum]|uniref:helix-hairpin-helix domain-containing protein n=1 Tax=[Clostridium] aminophilum TaxID=1526 RepID=UPI00332A4E35